MRFVPVRDVDQQAVLMLHRARSLMVASRTAQVNQIRGLLGEFGIVVPQGVNKLRERLPGILEDVENGLPGLGREIFESLLEQLRYFDEQLGLYDRRIAQIAANSEPVKRLMAIEGVGPITATAMVASVGDARTFQNGRQFAAWLGLTPSQNSSGGKTRLGRITKRGDTYLRTLLIHGSRAALRTAETKVDRKSRWAKALEERSGHNIAAVALAAKHARIIWAKLVRGTDYQSAAA